MEFLYIYLSGVLLIWIGLAISSYIQKIDTSLGELLFLIFLSLFSWIIICFVAFGCLMWGLDSLTKAIKKIIWKYWVKIREIPVITYKKDKED